MHHPPCNHMGPSQNKNNPNSLHLIRLHKIHTAFWNIDGSHMPEICQTKVLLIFANKRIHARFGLFCSWSLSLGPVLWLTSMERKKLISSSFSVKCMIVYMPRIKDAQIFTGCNQVAVTGLSKQQWQPVAMFGAIVANYQFWKNKHIGVFCPFLCTEHVCADTLSLIVIKNRCRKRFSWVDKSWEFINWQGQDGFEGGEFKQLRIVPTDICLSYPTTPVC